MNSFKIKPIMVAVMLVAGVSHVHAESWRKISDLQISESYVDRDSIQYKQEPNGQLGNQINYITKLVSKSKESGLDKGNYVLSNVIDDCTTHDQKILSLRIFDARDNLLTIMSGGEGYEDRQNLDRNSAQYKAHEKLCQELAARKNPVVAPVAKPTPPVAPTPPINKALTPIKALPVAPVVETPVAIALPKGVDPNNVNQQVVSQIQKEIDDPDNTTPIAKNKAIEQVQPKQTVASDDLMAVASSATTVATQTSNVPNVAEQQSPKAVDANAVATQNTDVNSKDHNWSYVGTSTNVKAYVDQLSIQKNGNTNRVTYLARFNINENLKGMFKTGESMMVRTVSDCSNGTMMKLSSIRYDLKGKELSRKNYSGSSAKFEKVTPNTLNDSVHKSVCS